MDEGYLMGLDAGSGSGRCLLVGLDSKRTISTGRQWNYAVAPGTGGWGYDMNCGRMWHLLGEASREALSKANAKPEQVLGVAVTSMRHTLVIIDGDGKVLLATPNCDARAASEGMALSDERGQEFHQRSGHWPSAIFAAARLLWLAQESPETLAQAYCQLSLSDWITYRLSGALSAEPSQAGETLLFDLGTREWAWDLIDSLDLRASMFPTLYEPGSCIGALGEEAAQNLGLRIGTPVGIGGADTQLGLLGCGAQAPGDLAVIAGTTAPIQIVIDHPQIDPQGRLWTGSHVLPERWVMESNAGGTGDAITWLAEALYPAAPSPVANLMAEASLSVPGAAGLFAAAGSQVFNAADMALPVGHLTFSHMLALEGSQRRRHIARAALEGVAYGLHANIEQLIEVAGFDQPNIYFSGGMSRSPLLAQVLSEITGKRIRVAHPQASAFGAAICAGAAAGLYPDLHAGVERLAKIENEYDPHPERQQLYQSLYRDWRSLQSARAEADKLVADLSVQRILSSPSSKEVVPQEMQFRPHILVTAEIDAIALDRLRQLGEVEYASYRQEMRMLTDEDLVQALQGFQVFVTEVDVVDAQSLQQLPDLRAIFSCRGNPVNIDISACTAHGIAVMHTPGRNADAVADLSLAFILMLARKIPAASQFLHQPGAEVGDIGRAGQAHFEFLGVELWRRTIGLVGFGAVGEKLAQRLQPFGARLLVYDPYVQEDRVILSGGELVSLDALLEASDVISLHAAVSAETEGMIGRSQFSNMKEGAFLINTARAALVDEEALFEALQNGNLGGAALDVFSVEPPGCDHPLLSLPNVIATPHIGGNTLEVAAHQGMMVAEDLSDLIVGQKPRHIWNPEVLPSYDWTGPRIAPPAELLRELSSSTAPAVSDLHLQKQSIGGKDEGQPAFAEIASSQASSSSSSKEAIAEEDQSLILSNHGVKMKMEELLQRFVDKLALDPSLKRFSEGKQVSMHYKLTDLGISFYTSFKDGEIAGGMGEPPESPDVTLKMKADLLDGMFTGRTNAMKAAMSGKLSFSGDTKKAMSLQKIQKDLMRLYSEAREEVGDPGDLSAIEQVGAPQPSTPSLPAAKPIAAPGMLVRKAGDERDEMLEILHELYTAGLITATGGNISCRIAGRQDQLWITPSQIHKGSLSPEMMVRIDMHGKALDEDAPSASSERLVHCSVLRRRADAEAIIHSHAPKTTTLGLCGLPFLPISTEAAFVGDIPRVPFIMPGTDELADAVAEALGEGVAVIMQNHGLVVAGSSLRRAADLTQIIEQTADKILTCYALGKKPPILPREVLKELREIGKMMV